LWERRDDDVKALPADRREERSNAAINAFDSVAGCIPESAGHGRGIDIGKNNFARTPRRS
jgi:hypothetical protein